MELPSDLEEVSLIKFDRLLRQGKLLYGDSVPERLEDRGFQFEFRVCPALRTKPSVVGMGAARCKDASPFVNPDPEFVVSCVGPLHTLILSKFCVYRPSYILHTNEYVSQSTDLDEPDIVATWSLLNHLKAPQMVIYNCGVESGASQGHKHIQLLPRPAQPCLELFPDRVELSLAEPRCIQNIPFKHWAIGIPMGATDSDVVKLYLLLLEAMKISLKGSPFAAYNLVMVKEWIIIIPRRHASRGAIRANSAGMMGLVWVQDEEEKNSWTQFGMTNALIYLGVPVEGGDSMKYDALGSQ